jgi:hypothetical protein
MDGQQLLLVIRFASKLLKGPVATGFAMLVRDYIRIDKKQVDTRRRCAAFVSSLKREFRWTPTTVSRLTGPSRAFRRIRSD